jgi:DNA-binding transcriptional ArsR family regulator
MNIIYDSTQLDTVLTALAHPKRRGIVHDLTLQPATVGQLARDHELSLPAIHRHIRTLEEAELIVRKKIGRTNFVALKLDGFRRIQVWIMQYRTEWGNDQASLENYIARMQE